MNILLVLKKFSAMVERHVVSKKKIGGKLNWFGQLGQWLKWRHMYKYV